MNTIYVYGTKDQLPDVPVINTTSHSPARWERELSPFYLGPIKLYDEHVALNVENAWQYAKVYKENLDLNGEPSALYWSWAKRGWSNPNAVRYPRGKGRKPSYLYWDGEKMDYITARLRVYFPIYRDAVRKMPAFTKLQEMFKVDDLHLWDFDGYNVALADALTNPNRPMGHAFVLKAMLLYGPDVTPEIVAEEAKKERDRANKHFLDFDY